MFKMFKMAAAQAAPAFLDKAGTTAKIVALITEAGANGADIIGFPETFLPGYPGWVELLPLSEEPARKLFTKLFHEAVEVPGPETDAIGAACKEANIYAVVGVNEKRKGTTGTLWNTNLFFGRDGTLLHKHQKYTPTIGEKLIHAPGETGSKTSINTDFGPVSSLICGENGNALAQYSVGLDYPVVHVASWPPHFSIGGVVDDLAKVISAGVSLTLGCYVINSIALVDDAAIEAYGETDAIRDYLKSTQQRRQSSIIGPRGVVLAQGSGDESIIYAEGDTDTLIRHKYSLVSRAIVIGAEHANQAVLGLRRQRALQQTRIVRASL